MRSTFVACMSLLRLTPQLPRHAPPSLSLRSLGAATRSLQMNAIFAVICSLFVTHVNSVSASPPIPVPRSFLQTDIAPLQRLLAVETTANFSEADIRQAIEYIKSRSRDTDVGYRLDVIYALHEPFPRITHQFKAVPLRTFFYLLSQDTGLTVEWVYEKHLPHAIRIRRP